MRSVLLLALLVSSGACATAAPQLSRAGLTDHRYALRVRAAGPGVFVSEDWLVENLVRVAPGDVEVKRGGGWDAQYRIDFNNDGRAEVFREHAYILKLRHRRNVGVLWSSVVPLPPSMEQTELRVLARLLVDAASRDSVTLSVNERDVDVETRRLATRTLSEGPISVRGFEGYHVVFEIADVDQASLTPNTTWERREVVMARPGFVWLAHASIPAPTLLLIGHANLPDDFATTQPDFVRFVAAFEFRESELSGSRRALRECAPNAELVGVARLASTVPTFVAVGSNGAAECFARARPGGEPNVSFGVRREPFAAPSLAESAAPPTTDPAEPAHTTEPVPSEPAAPPIEAAPAGEAGETEAPAVL
ncbi:MAG: hypothetical protein H6722_20240 [Sandaracinus sp.]|nr:hypothetical protein [Sandaracinus sp.]MCB9624163.1 hypothetical protein [Sandaracinus sp.]